ncbi:hypothetical protein JHK85_018536 [Glycine max]|nr:hypothetical protein JHK85_018536 [Glycine max]
MEVRTNEVAKQRIEDEGYRAHNNPFGLNLFLFSSFCQPYMASLATVQDERCVQRSYWIEHTTDLSVESMMLDSNASDLDKEERPEVLSLLPAYEGKSVVELGAGIGRFTGELAKKAGQLLAVDFIESAIKKNESINGHHKNVKFMCADVTSPNLHISEGSVDLMFSNWLLMYLSDKEVENLAARMIKWLKVGGYVFFRESCFHQSGDSKRKYNPTHYREPRFYTKVFKECHTSDDTRNSFELSLVGCKCIGAYVRNKKNQNQICWIWKKVRSQDDRGFQRFLDSVEYNHKDILLYESVFGQGFVSTGGLETTKEFVAKLGLKPGQKVLDVGCGTGGGDIYMAENFDVEMLENAGFDDVVAEDRTNLEDYNEITERWKAKQMRGADGEQIWSLELPAMSVELKLSRSNRIYRPSEALEGKIIVKTQSSISHYGIRLTVKGSVNLQVRGGSAGVVESFYGVIKPIPIVNRTIEVKSSGKIGSGTSEIPFSVNLRQRDENLERFYETFHGANISIQLFRVESVLLGEKIVTETSLVQTTQASDGKDGFILQYNVNIQE